MAESVDPDSGEEAQEQEVSGDEPTASREELLDQAYENWHAELAERALTADQTTSDVGSALVDLTHPHPTGSALFASGSPVRITSLVRESFAQQRAMKNLQRLNATTARIAEEYGHAPVSLAVGQFTWTELPPATEPGVPAHFDAPELTGEFAMVDVEPASDGDEWTSSDEPASGDVEPDASTADDGGARPEQPQLAEPAEAEPPREAKEINEYALFRALELKFDGDDAAVRQLKRTEFNPAFLRALRENGATAEHLTQLRQAAQRTADLDELFALAESIGRMYLPGFASEMVAHLGCFERPERTLLADLEAMEPYIRTSGIMMALAGDAKTRKLSVTPLPPGKDEDRAPEVERGAGDLDVAELNAVEAVASGRSVVLDCPPGSRRFETIASICADAAASNRSILVVPARLSSGCQLIDELEHLGLGDLVLDFSDVDGAAQRIRTGLRLERPELPTDETLELRARLVSARQDLESFVGDLHREEPEWGTSVRELLEKLASLMAQDDAPQTRIRLGQKAVNTMKDQGFDAVRADLDRAAELGAFDPEISSSAWASSTISSASEGTKALDAVRRLRDIRVPAAISQSSRSAGETSMKQPTTLAQWFEQIDVLDGISDSLDTFVPQVFETSPLNMAIACAPRDWRDSHGHSMKLADRRRYKKQALDLVRPGESTANLHEELLKVQKRREVWRRYSTDGGWPTLPDGMAQIRATRIEVQQDLESLMGHLDGEPFFDMEFEELQSRLSALGADADHMATLPERNALLGTLREAGFGEFLDDVVARGVVPEGIAAELDLAYTSAVFEEIIGKSDALSSLGPRDLVKLLETLCECDRAHTRTLAGPVLRAVVNNSRALMQSRRQETLKLDQALAEQGTGGLRDAIATHSRLVQAARPVWVVPATVLAEFIPPMPWADLVIVEAANSVAQLISPMMRGRQAVLVADLKRPGAENVQVFADVLPVAELPTYQAQHDALSTFALKELGYDHVALPPSVDATRSSKLVYVDGRGVPGTSGEGAVESTQVEVDAVVDAVLDHAMSRPEESLAVVTVSPTHANRVREAVETVGSRDVENLAGFVITDITQATGLKRDHVILSVGYGKTVHGRVLHSFGALATPDGPAGLIDAVCAASSELTIVSALGPGDIDARRVSTAGPRLLSRLIDEASGGEVSHVVSDDEVAPLLADVANRLHDRGWSTRASYGYQGSPRIPLVVGRGGEYAVAVVMDDPAYVNEKSLRRRDRFWIDVLHSRGWQVFQTFSSSLFIDPEGQVNAIEELLRERFPDEPAPVRVPTLVEESVELAQGWNEPELDELNPGIDNPDEGLRPRGERPQIAPGLSLAAYTDDQLDDMIAWIASDGKVRGEDELVDELRAELGIERRGEQIDVVLRNVARRSGLIAVAAEPREPAEDHSVTGSLDLGDEGPVLGDDGER
ncbi:hypothetical protein J2S70_000756 [Trueperella bonasi]|uniref:Restriction endonuclease type II-like domain-containing protein n=1 Tax=Trueperella bonasi TaxID=312286 RepID=A0ABT9NFR8_9ACTO|nr:hypothetical protein [Trueperella bonasi]MDP9806174.1 hypothetical protein [Trueperella bonasi]